MKRTLSVLMALGLSAPAWATSSGVLQLKEAVTGYQQAYQEKNWAIAENHINFAAKILRKADSSGDADIFLDPDYQSVRLKVEDSIRQYHSLMAVQAYLEANEALKQFKAYPDPALRESARKNCLEGIRRINILKRYGFDPNAEMTAPSGVRVLGSRILDFCQEQVKALKTE